MRIVNITFSYFTENNTIIDNFITTLLQSYQNYLTKGK